MPEEIREESTTSYLEKQPVGVGRGIALAPLSVPQYSYKCFLYLLADRYFVERVALGDKSGAHEKQKGRKMRRNIFLITVGDNGGNGEIGPERGDL